MSAFNDWKKNNEKYVEIEGNADKNKALKNLPKRKRFRIFKKIFNPFIHSEERLLRETILNFFILIFPVIIVSIVLVGDSALKTSEVSAGTAFLAISISFIALLGCLSYKGILKYKKKKGTY